MRFLVLMAGIVTLASCGQEAVRPNGPLSNAPQEPKNLNPSISSVSNRAFKWQEDTAFSRDGIYYAKLPSSFANPIFAAVFAVEDLSQYQGELHCTGDCVIVSRTNPSQLKCKLVGNFRYEHVTDASEVPASIEELMKEAFQGSQEAKDSAHGSPPWATQDEGQRLLKREFDRTFNRVKSQFKQVSNKIKFQIGEFTYEGETAEIFDRYKANGIGKLSRGSSLWMITTFHLGDNWIPSEGIYADENENLVCAGTIQDLKVVPPSICLKNGVYEKKTSFFE